LENYFLYRVDTGYDGFLPSRIPERSDRGVLGYNWACYLESLEPGDIVLTYFKGTECRPGIYAVGVVRHVDVTTRRMNVTVRLLRYSADNRAPLLPVRGNETLFQRLRTRPRGSEVIVPETREPDIYRALSADNRLLAEAAKRNVILPGAKPYAVGTVADVPLVDPASDLADPLRRAGLVAGFWVRPQQASWITAPPQWLHFITRAFGRFKAGDALRLDELANALARQVRNAVPNPKQVFGVIVGVPLSESKRQAGEADRVAELGEQVAALLGVPYSDALRLDGAISRRLYKNKGKTTEEFKADYRAALKVMRTTALSECVRSGRTVLLLDDVYTDGVTTGIVAEALREAFPSMAVDIRIATLMINAKKRNMDEDLVESWS